MLGTRSGAALLLALSIISTCPPPAAAVDRESFIQFLRAHYQAPVAGYWNMEAAANPLGSQSDSANFVSQAMLASGGETTKSLDLLQNRPISYGGKNYAAYYKPKGAGPCQVLRAPGGAMTFVDNFELRNYLQKEELYDAYTLYDGSPYFQKVTRGDIVYLYYNSTTRRTPEGFRDQLAGVVDVQYVNGRRTPILTGRSPAYDRRSFDEMFGDTGAYQFDGAILLHYPTYEEMGRTYDIIGGGHDTWSGSRMFKVRLYRPVGHDPSNPLEEIFGIAEYSNVNRRARTYQCGFLLTRPPMGFPSSRFVEGYCADEGAAPPDKDCVYSPPWWINSSSHWTYWLRELGWYSLSVNASTTDTQEATWYITDRGGEYNALLQAIGYPRDGPTKNTSADQTGPAAVSGLSATASLRGYVPDAGSVVLRWTNPADPDFRGIVVVAMKGDQVPIDPSDGMVLINMLGEPGQPGEFIHRSGIVGFMYTYAVFPYDQLNNFGTEGVVDAIYPPRGNGVESWRGYP